MRRIALVLLCAAACGGPERPILSGAPHPDTAAVAGGAAAAAAAMTLVDPNAATRGKPEKAQPEQEKAPVEVKEHVPSAVFDRLDQGSAEGPAAGSGSTKPAAVKKRKGPLPKLPSPKDAAEREQGPGE